MPLKAQIFGNGQLFNDTQMPDAVSTGAVEIGGLTMDFINQDPVKPLRIEPTPYAFTSWDSLWAAQDTAEYADIFEQQYAAMGMQFLSALPYGTIEFYSSKALRVPGDLKGQRIRSFGIDTSHLIEEVGATPVSMSSQEVYQALQRGTIDGLVTGAPSIYSRKLYEVVKYGTAGKMIFYSAYSAANKTWWNSLPEDVQKAIAAADETARASARSRVKEEDSQMTASLKEAGMTLVTPTTEERDEWIAASKGRVNSYVEGAGEIGSKLLAIVEGTNRDHPAD